jgi:hypothetical protein
MKLFQPFSDLYVYTSHYEPDPATDSITALAARGGKDEIETMYDYLGGGGVLWKPQVKILQV